MNESQRRTKEAPREEGGVQPAKTPERWSPKNWLTFLGERAPPLVFLLLAAGPSLSGLTVVEGKVHFGKFLWAVIGELMLLLVVRVMDDVKDYEKDKIVHPERPLPRGLISYKEVVHVIHASLALMALYAVSLGWWFNWEVGFTYGLQAFYTFLMYIEFGAGEWLEERPFLYGLIHQAAIYFGAMFICTLGGAPWYSSLGFLVGSVAFSGFFTYEICRKLDPTLPKLKGTYLVVYGKWPTFLFTVGTVSVGVVSSYLMGLHWMLWPLQALMIGSLLLLFLLPMKDPKPKAHKPVEALAIVYVLLHMWAPYLASFVA